MATSKKAPAKVAPKAEKKQKKVKVEKGAAITSTLGGVVFEVSAVIPTQAYGNIQPRVQIVCSTVEEGRGIVMPLIESLFEQYAETRPTFLGKVVETVRTVVPAMAGADLRKGEAVKEAPEATTPPQAPAQDVPAPQATASTVAPERPKSESVKKAEKMISLANSPEAILKIQGQIEASVKLTAEEKPALLNLVLKRRGELK